MRILLTGATGFVGKAIHERLYKHTVLLTSRSEPSGNSNIFFQKYMSSTEDFSDCLYNVDVVIHAAARVHQMNDQSQDPLSEFMEVNCFGTLNLARQAAEAGVKRFVFLSSIKVNGEKTQSGVPFRFNDASHSNDPYGISKAEAEVGLLKIALETNLEVIIIRPPLVYGPGVKANFKSLMRIAERNIPLPLGAIRNKRSFVAVDNLVDLINICVDHPDAVNKVFLVSDDSDISTPELVTLMANAFGSKAHLLNISPRLLKLIAKIIGKQSIVDRLCDDFQIDIKHTKDTLGWKPRISMTEGIRRCADHIKNTG